MQLESLFISSTLLSNTSGLFPVYSLLPVPTDSLGLVVKQVTIRKNKNEYIHSFYSHDGHGFREHKTST